MRLFAPAIVAALGLGGCVTTGTTMTAQLHADEAEIAATVKAVKQNIAVAPSTIAKTNATVCGYGPLVAHELATVRAVLDRPGPKTRKALNAAGAAMAAVDAYCAGGGQSGSNLGQIVGLWRAYQAAKAAAAEAKKAAGA